MKKSGFAARSWRASTSKDRDEHLGRHTNDVHQVQFDDVFSGDQHKILEALT
jgi:hypothetical protein